MRKIAQELSVSPQTVSNWIRAIVPTSVPVPATSPPHKQPSRERSTIEHVALRAGVSTSTVSNYLNDKGRMSPRTRHRIEDAIKALHFTPNELTRAIRRGRTNTVGVVSYGIEKLDMASSPVPPVLSAINDAADSASLDVLLYTGWPHRRRSRTGSDFLNGQIDGLLWMSPQPHDSQLRIAADGGLPVMALLSRRVPNGVGYVVCDNVGGIRDVVQHLASLGHTRIAHLGSSDASDFVDRSIGYREGLEAQGIPYDPSIEATLVWKPWTPEFIAPIIDEWLGRPDRPTAIVTIHDRLAETVIEIIHGCGLSVPHDVAVTGFDDLPVVSNFIGGITTARQPFRDIGRIAVERLAAMITGAPVAECCITLPTTLVIRASTESGIY